MRCSAFLATYPQSLEIAKALEQAGVLAGMITVDGAGRGTGSGPSVMKSIRTFPAHHLLGSEEAVEDGTIKACG